MQIINNIGNNFKQKYVCILHEMFMIYYKQLPTTMNFLLKKIK